MSTFSFPTFRRLFRAVPSPAVSLTAALALFTGQLAADPLSKKYDIDFYRDIPSRNLKGLATRSDGRLVAGPVLTELAAAAPLTADLLWTLESAGAPDRWLLGTGPDGRILEAALDIAKSAFTTRELVKLDEPHIFALRRLSDGALLVGTSPHGVLFLVRDGKVAARASLPVDSIFDLLLLDPNTALIATGNPARLYRVDLKQFATSGVAPEKLITPAQFTARGLVLVGEIRDRNIRRLARFADGRIAAGSSPKGNIYVFPASISAPSAAKTDPVLLQENRDAEVTDLLPQANGDLYATLVFSSSGGDARINLSPSKSAKDSPDSASGATTVSFAPPTEKFSGRSTLVFFPSGGFPEILSSRSNLAFYQIARRGETLLIAGGEQGELLGYDLTARLPLTYAGSASSQLNALAAIPGTTDRFLVLRNNAPGLAVLDFKATAERSAETRRIDLGTPALFGALRFDRLRDLAPAQLALEIKTSVGSDEVEGWTAWTPLLATDASDTAWRAPALRGRYAKLRLKLPATAAALEVEKPAFYFLPQNRRPTLQEFRFLTPNFALIPGAEPAPSVMTSLSSLLSGSKDDDMGAAKRSKAGFLASQIVPSPGAQVAMWTLVDPDGDNVTATFSIRRDGETAWADLAVSSREPYISFDTARLADGIYFTRLVATEAAPRVAAERLSITFETDNLIVDHTPPAILDAAVVRTAEALKVTVRGRDALSLLEGIEVVFNNGVHETVEQPVDGIRDGREETFALEVPLARAQGATAVEVTLYDVAGNAATRRLTL